MALGGGPAPARPREVTYGPRLWRVPTRVGRYLRQYHLVHHYKTPDRHFGVSSPLWDFVFRIW